MKSVIEGKRKNSARHAEKRESEEVRMCMGGRENKRARLQIGPDAGVASVSGLAFGSQGRAVNVWASNSTNTAICNIWSN